MEYLSTYFQILQSRSPSIYINAYERCLFFQHYMYKYERLDECVGVARVLLVSFFFFFFFFAQIQGRIEDLLGKKKTNICI